MSNIARCPHSSLRILFLGLPYPPPHIRQSTRSWSTESSLSPTLLTSGFQDATLQDIRTAATTDPEQVALRSVISTGWPNDKAAVPELARPYWSLRHELTYHVGLLFKQDRIIIPSCLRTSLLHKLHAAHRGSEFTLRHARNCVFWRGLHTQITNMCQSCVICARHAQQHLREPLQPYPVPTLPWQLVFQDLFELNGRAYMVAVDHYSDFYETDHLPTIQSSAVIQASKQHFGRHGIPHTLITDNGAQFTSDLFRTFSRTYGFNHVTTSPSWSQSNGRAEAAVKSAKHILLTAEDVDFASNLSVIPHQRDIPFRLLRACLAVCSIAIFPSLHLGWSQGFSQKGVQASYGRPRFGKI